MSSIEGIDKIGEQAARISIDGPDSGRAPDALEQRLADEVDGIDSVEIHGPNGTRGAAAVEELATNAFGGTSDLDRVREKIADDGQTEAFDVSAYVAVPEVDGQTTDKLVIAFSGSVAYDATDIDGAKLFNDLALGKAVELRIAGYVANKQGAYKVTATEEEVITGKATVRVDTLYLLAPEAL